MSDSKTASPASTTTKPVQIPTTGAGSVASTSAPVVGKTGTNTGSTTAATTPKPEEQKFTYLLKITIGELVFSNLAGDFLGTPVIRLRTRQFSEIDFVLNALKQVDGSDTLAETKAQGTQSQLQPVAKPQNAADKANPAAAITAPGQTTQTTASPTNPPTTDAIRQFLPQIGKDVQALTTSTPTSTATPTTGGDLWAQIKENMGAKIKVELGFLPDHVYTVLDGQAYRIGRKMPDGVIIEVVDSSAVLAQTTGGTALNAQETPSTAHVKVNLAELKLLADDKKPPSLFQQFATGEAAITPGANEQTKGTQVASVPNQPAPSQSAKGISTADLQAFMSDAPGSVTPTTTATAQPNTPAAAGVTMQAQAAAAVSKPGAAQPKTPTEQFANQKGLQFSKQTQGADGTQGTATFGVPPLQIASTAAAKQGDVIVAEGNQIKQVGPGQGEPTGIVLDWNQHKNVFIKPPTISKKTPLQLQSGAGAMTVQNFSVADKSMQSATVVTPGGFSPNPNGVLVVPEWSAVRLGDSIPGSSFTWGDATAQGNRKPESKKVMEGIVAIAGILEQIQKKFGVRLQITSWYRDPATNVRVSSSGPNGPHTTGGAADFYCEPGKLIAIHKEFDKNWEGGVAIHPAVYSGNGGFVHIDMQGTPGFPSTPRRRWSY